MKKSIRGRLYCWHGSSIDQLVVAKMLLAMKSPLFKIHIPLTAFVLLVGCEDKTQKSARTQNDASGEVHIADETVLNPVTVETDKPKKEPVDEIALLRKKAEGGDAEAQWALAEIYAFGEGMPKDTVEAVKWYRMAAEQGHAGAQFGLGYSYSLGKGVPKDAAEAVKWYQMAAEQGYAAAQFSLGRCYASGDGVPKDSAEAVKWYRLAAEQGHAAAQSNLGSLYYHGDGIPKDFVQAVKLFRMAAEQGNAIAQFSLGVCYASGKGVPKDSAEAVKWYRLAAEQGNAIAQFSLGVCYASGKGVPKDSAEAVKWYKMAAEQGHARAQLYLGVFYYNGNGILKDTAEALKWYRMAAEQGEAAAQFNLGVCYASGEGVVKNEIEGYKWFLIVAALGNTAARENVDFLERRITANQRAEGQRLAQAWQAKREEQKNATDSETLAPGSVGIEEPKGNGTGFFITSTGYIVTNHHVVEGTSRIRVVTSSGTQDAVVVRVDETSDLALLKVTGTFDVLPVVSSRSARLGATVATVGFPNIELQGFEPKLSKGEISSLSGIQDNVKYFQISVPIQPGNSGSPLVDARGNVVGVVTSQLSQEAALKSTGTLAQSVNYAVKSSYLLGFIEAVPDASERMPDAKTHEQEFEAMVDDVKKATVLIITY